METLISTSVTPPSGPSATTSARRPLPSGTSHIDIKSWWNSSRQTPRATSPATSGASDRSWRWAAFIRLIYQNEVGTETPSEISGRKCARRPGSPLDRKSVVSGKSVSVRVDIGGRRLNQKKKQTQYKD